MENYSSKPRSLTNMALLMGFTDELQKISMSFGLPKVPGLGDANRAARKAAKDSLTSKPKLVAKPQKPVPAAPTQPQTVDFLSSSRTIQPPPVTIGGNQ